MKLKGQVWQVCRVKHYSPRTATSYWGWIARFLRHAAVRYGRWIHPSDLTAGDVEQYLTHLATERKVAASTQNQCVNALVFLYRDVLKQDLGGFWAVKVKRPLRLPTVLNRDEVAALLGALDSPLTLLCGLMYGSGPRCGRQW